MQIPEHKYLVDKVFQPDTTRNGNHKFQRIVLVKPGWTDEFGDKKGPDDFLECNAWNKKIDEVPPGLKRGDKVKAQLTLSGRANFDQGKNETYYQLQLSIRKIELL